jgi:hypothetical protein
VVEGLLVIGELISIQVKNANSGRVTCLIWIILEQLRNPRGDGLDLAGLGEIRIPLRERSGAY